MLVCLAGNSRLYVPLGMRFWVGPGRGSGLWVSGNVGGVVKVSGAEFPQVKRKVIVGGRRTCGGVSGARP